MSEAESGEETTSEEIPAEEQTSEQILAKEEQEASSEEGKSGEEKPDGVQAAINKQHLKFRDEERSHSATKEELAAANARLAEIQAPDTTLQAVPDMPDSFDDDFNEQVAARDAVIQRNAEIAASNRFNQQQQAAATQEANRAQLADLSIKQDKYTAKAIEFGITSEELKTAGTTVGGYGLDPHLVMGIFGDTDGPLLTKYLAANPLELDALRRMDPFSAGIHIQQNIRVKAQELRPKSTKAGDPPTEIPKGGVKADDNKYPNSKGATFD